MNPFLIICILLCSCLSCNTNTIFGNYTSEPLDVGSGISLFEDSSYQYGYFSCLVSGYDSGKFTMRKDTIYLTSLIENRVDTNNKYHNQVRPQTGNKFLIRNGRIYFHIENGIYDKRIFWLHEDMEVLPSEVLDSTGNGYARIYNGRGRTIKYGIFKNLELYDGHVLFYSNSNHLRKIEIYKNGLKVKDSLISYLFK